MEVSQISQNDYAHSEVIGCCKPSLKTYVYASNKKCSVLLNKFLDISKDANFVG